MLFLDIICILIFTSFLFLEAYFLDSKMDDFSLKLNLIFSFLQPIIRWLLSSTTEGPLFYLFILFFSPREGFKFTVAMENSGILITWLLTY